MVRLVRLLVIVVMAMTIATPGNAQEQPAPPAEAPVRVFFGPKDGSDGGAFQATIEPGASQALTVVIGNYGQEEIELRTYAGNAYTAVNGGFALRAEDDSLVAPATWLGYPTESFVLAPGEGVERSFTVTVPPDAAAGWYIAGIAVQNVDPVAMGGGGLSQVIRKVSGVSILVPGEITPGAELGTPTVTTSTTGATLVIPIEITGNIRMTPQGELSLSDATGVLVMTVPVTMRPVYAGHSTTIEIPLPPQLVPGDYAVNLQLTDADGSDWSASLEGQPVTLPEPAASTPDLAPIEMAAASVTPAAGTAAGSPPPYADVSVTIVNASTAVPSARLTLIANRDGVMVEEFVLVSSLALVEPETIVTQRYIPAGGFTAGTWTFELVLHGIDPATGSETLLAEDEVPGTIEIAG